MWKFFTRDVEFGEGLVFCVSQGNLLFNPSRSEFHIDGIQFAVPCHRTANHGFRLLGGGAGRWPGFRINTFILFVHFDKHLYRV